MRHTPNYHLPQWDPEDRIRREDFNGANETIDATLQTAGYVCDDQGGKFRAVAGPDLLPPDRVFDAYDIYNRLGMTFFNYGGTEHTVASNGQQAVFAGKFANSPDNYYFYVYHYAKQTGFKRIAFYSGQTNNSRVAVSLSESGGRTAYLYAVTYNGSSWTAALSRVNMEDGAVTQISAQNSSSFPGKYIASVSRALVSFYGSGNKANAVTQNLANGALSAPGDYTLASDINSLYLHDVHNDHAIIMGYPNSANAAYAYDYNMITGGWRLIQKVSTSQASKSWCLYSDTAQKWFLYFRTDNSNYTIYTWDMHSTVMVGANVQISGNCPSIHNNLTRGYGSAFDASLGMVAFCNAEVSVFDKDTGLPLKSISLPGPAFSVMSQVANGRCVYLVGNYHACALDLISGDLRRLAAVPGCLSYHMGERGNRLGVPLVDSGRLLALIRPNESNWNDAPLAAATYSDGNEAILGVRREAP